MSTIADRVVNRVASPDEPEEEERGEEVGELEVSEYVVFLLALDTYNRYIEEVEGEDVEDDLVRKGVSLLRRADRKYQNTIHEFLEEKVVSPSQKKMIHRAFNFKPNAFGMSRRTIWVRTAISRGGTSTMRAIFKKNLALRKVREAVEASMMDDADSALDKFASIPMRNAILRKWIKEAGKIAGSGAYQNAIAIGSDESADDVAPIMTARVQQQGETPTSEKSQESGGAGDDLISSVQEKATEAAVQAMEVSGEEDSPPVKSQVVGIATAAAVAVITDPDNPQNVPEPLRKLDDEQRAAALTDGRVLIAAGAGSGKSTTMVSRIEYLIKDRRVNPSRILATSFNTKAANELAQKIGVSVGGDDLKQMSVGTMHSLFKRFIGEYGTAQERTSMGLNKNYRKAFIKQGGPVARAVQNMWVDCYGEESSPPKMKNVTRMMALWSGNMVTPEEAKKQAQTEEERDAANWYEMYEGLKGAIPGWQPPCRGKPYNSFMSRWRPNGERLGDFSDMIKIFLDILEREPQVRKKIQSSLDHIIVDECVHESTEVLTKEGESKSISELEVGEEILSFCNGSATFKKVVAKKQSSKTSGLTVHTSSGRSLTMTRDHRLYATRFDPTTISEGEMALYLMFRKDMGYRIGVSTVPYLLNRTTQSSDAFRSHRAGTEKADCLWILEVGSESDILYKELDYSLQYQIPARLFEAEVRFCDQERSDKIFAKYGQNGSKLLEVYGLHQDFPHWVSSSHMRRKVVSIKAHRLGGHGHRTTGRRTTASFSWTTGVNEPFVLEGCKVYSTHGGTRKMASVSDVSYVAASQRARYLASYIDAYVVEDILVEGESCVLTNAGSLMVGMRVPTYLSGLDNSEEVVSFLRGKEIRQLADKYQIRVPAKGCIHASIYETIRQAHFSATGEQLKALNDSKFYLDPIVDIEPVEDETFYDITVEDTGNFFGNGILSHNCQDLNQVQNRILELMSEHITDGSDGKSICMVGDDSQSIYGFRAARPDIFIDRANNDAWKLQKMRTNYRCPPEVVDAANRLIQFNENRIDMEANTAPGRARGMASLKVETSEDEATAALNVVEEIKVAVESGGSVSDNAILTRTNKEQHSYETACIIRGIPYARKGASSFLGSPETKAFLSYVQLATGSDFKKMQKALEEVINRPNRFFVSPDQGAEAVETAFSDYARRSGKNLKDIHPMAAMDDDLFLEILASKLTRSRSGFKFNKGLEKLGQLKDDIDQMRVNSEDDAYTTKDMFDDILNMTGVEGVTNPRTGKVDYVEQTFRDSLKAFTRDSVSEEEDLVDEDEEDETAGLGNISFLYELMKPDPTDPDDSLNDPGTPFGFKSKMERYAKKARELRVDITKWDKAQEALPPEDRKPPPGVYIGTVHSTKGAQWANCYVQMPKGKFPFEPPVRPGEEPKPEAVLQEEMESERRLGYVAITRAAKNLTIVCPSEVGGKAAGVSPFVDESGLTVGENVTKPGAETVDDEPAVKTASIGDGYDGLVPDEWDEAKDWSA